MMKFVALFGLFAGGFVALGRLSAAQWHTIGVALLALTLAHGLTVLPWLLAALAAWRYWYWKRHAMLYETMAADGIEMERTLRAEIWEKDRALERRPQQRKRAMR